VRQEKRYNVDPTPGGAKQEPSPGGISHEDHQVSCRAGALSLAGWAAAWPGSLFWHFSHDLPDYQQTRRLRAADCHARPRRRWQVAGGICQRTASLRPGQRDPHCASLTPSLPPRTRTSTPHPGLICRRSCAPSSPISSVVGSIGVRSGLRNDYPTGGEEFFCLTNEVFARPEDQRSFAGAAAHRSEYCRRPHFSSFT